MAIMGIASSVAGGISSAKGASSNERLSREQIAAAEREGQKSRDNYNKNWHHYLRLFNDQVTADVARRKPLTDAVAANQPAINSMFFGPETAIQRPGAAATPMPEAAPAPVPALQQPPPPTLQSMGQMLFSGATTEQ